jgi:hypothetical protein
MMPYSETLTNRPDAVSKHQTDAVAKFMAVTQPQGHNPLSFSPQGLSEDSLSPSPQNRFV